MLKRVLYLLGAVFQDNVDIFIVFEAVVEAYDVRMDQIAMQLNFPCNLYIKGKKIKIKDKSLKIRYGYLPPRTPAENNLLFNFTVLEIAPC